MAKKFEPTKKILLAIGFALTPGLIGWVFTSFIVPAAPSFWFKLIAVLGLIIVLAVLVYCIKRGLTPIKHGSIYILLATAATYVGVSAASPIMILSSGPIPADVHIVTDGDRRTIVLPFKTQLSVGRDLVVQYTFEGFETVQMVLRARFVPFQHMDVDLRPPAATRIVVIAQFGGLNFPDVLGEDGIQGWLSNHLQKSLLGRISSKSVRVIAFPGVITSHNEALDRLKRFANGIVIWGRTNLVLEGFSLNVMVTTDDVYGDFFGVFNRTNVIPVSDPDHPFESLDELTRTLELYAILFNALVTLEDDPSTAGRYFTAALETYPNTSLTAAIHLYLGISKHRTSDFAGAEESFRKALAMDDSLLEGYLLLMSVLASSSAGDDRASGGRLAEVMSLHERLTRQTGRLRRTVNGEPEVVDLFMALDFYEGSKISLNVFDLIRQLRLHLKGNAVLAIAAFKAGEFSMAEELLQFNLLQPNSGMINSDSSRRTEAIEMQSLLLSLTLMNQGEYERAIAELEAREFSHLQDFEYLYLGLARYAFGDVRNARSALRLAARRFSMRGDVSIEAEVIASTLRRLEDNPDNKGEVVYVVRIPATDRNPEDQAEMKVNVSVQYDGRTVASVSLNDRGDAGDMVGGDTVFSGLCYISADILPDDVVIQYRIRSGPDVLDGEASPHQFPAVMLPYTRRLPFTLGRVLMILPDDFEHWVKLSGQITSVSDVR